MDLLIKHQEVLSTEIYGAAVQAALTCFRSGADHTLLSPLGWNVSQMRATEAPNPSSKSNLSPKSAGTVSVSHSHCKHR